MGETDWNLAKNRVQFIGEIVNKVRAAHYKVQNKNTVKYLKTYRNILNTLYFEIDLYVENWETNPDQTLDAAAEELRGRNSDRELNGKLQRVFDNLQQLDKEINRKRKEIGLDIPEGYEPDPESALGDQV